MFLFFCGLLCEQTEEGCKREGYCSLERLFFRDYFFLCTFCVCVCVCVCVFVFLLLSIIRDREKVRLALKRAKGTMKNDEVERYSKNVGTPSLIMDS